MLIIFDVDGTLIDADPVDWSCFAAALQDVTGFVWTEEFWAGLTEVTAKAIEYAALPGHSAEERSRLEELVRAKFVEKLRAAHAASAVSFRPLPGAAALLAHLRSAPGIDVAVATGDWKESIMFKLEAAGLDISGIPLATASDCLARADIIQLAAERAGYNLSQVIYVGDGLWDFRACQKLGIPFLGVGHRRPQFLEAGVVHLLHTLEKQHFEPWLAAFRAGQIHDQ